MSKFGDKIARRLSAFAVTLMLAATFHPESFGQGSTQIAATPGAPAGSYKLSDFDTVNLFSGNLNFNLPLAGLKGRGDFGSSVSLTIEQQWSISEVSADEWHIRNHISPVINAVGHLRINGYIQQSSELCLLYPNTATYWTTYQLHLTFVDQDGTEIRLVDAAYKGDEKNICGVTSLNYGTVFASTDGGSLTFVSDSNIIGTDTRTVVGLGATGYLYRDGGYKSRVENGAILWTKDRNGNTTEYEYGSGGGFPDGYPDAQVIRDSVGREITFEGGVIEPAPYGLCHKIIYKGFGGAERVIRISVGNPVRSPVAGTDDDFEVVDIVTTDPGAYPRVTGTTFDWSQSAKAVWLPDGRSYQFTYNVNGRLAKVALPTGGYIEYDFYKTLGESYWQWDYFRNQVKERRVFNEAGELQQKTTFVYDLGSYGSFSTRTTVSRFDGSNNLVEKSRHYLYGQPTSGVSGWYNPTGGKEGKTEYLDLDGATVLRTTETGWQSVVSGACYIDVPTPNPCGLSPYPQIPNTRAVVAWTKTTLSDTNQVSLATSINPSTGSLAYDLYGNRTDLWYYDYGSGTQGAFVKREHTDYVTGSNYVDRFLRSLPSEIWVSSDPSGNTKVSRTQFEYDNYSDASEHPQHDPLISRSFVIGHDATNFGTGFSHRGNPTGVTSNADAGDQTGAVSSYSLYDVLGNVVKTLDANGNETAIGYTDNFGAPNEESRTNTPPAQLNGQLTFAFPTSATNPLGWVAYTQFDYFTGAPVNTEDVNAVISKMLYNDSLDRLTQSVSAVNTSLERQSNVIYDDANRRIETRSDLNELEDNLLRSESFYDGLGRTIETRSYKDGGFAAVKTEYDAIGRVRRATNPYRPHLSEPILWTERFYDALGRTTKVRTPDGAEVLSSFVGNATTVTDQSGKQRRSITNGLGQLVRVDEPNDAGQLGAIAAPNQPTNYSYDTLNNLTTVTQGVQTRTFAYDSLSRLSSASNPESGTIEYTYYPNGNLQTKTDPRGVRTDYIYDALNRVTNRNYSLTGPTPQNYQATPNVSYFYDNLPNAKGKLIKVTNGTGTDRSTTEYTAFDILGRVTAHRQTTDETSYTTGYVCNLSGALIEETYPSGRVVRNTLDADGDLQQVESRRANDTFRNYANSFNYTPAGAVASMRLGNGKWESTQFNSRLQPVQIGLGSSASAQNLLKLNFDYGTTDNNGNVKSQQIAVPAIGGAAAYTATQVYTYDSLNRIKQATETIPAQTGWQQTFVYDRYGNRRFDAANTTTLAPGCAEAVCNPQIDPATNKLIGYTFDQSGNTIRDAENRRFTYDAENKQTKVETLDANGNPTATVGEYFYNGDGQRVKKVVPTTGETTIFVYDAASKLVAEYSTQVEPASTAKISYLTNDHLGSPRITTDALGQTISRRDFRPFGEEIPRAGYGGDSVRQKFTGYERDSEINLDFAQARYLASDHGRFTSPDPYKIVAEVQNEPDAEKAKAMLIRYLMQPQQWNQYPYAINNPLKYTDPTGEIIELTGTEEEQKAALARIRAMLGEERFALVKQSTVNGNIQLTIDSKDIQKFAGIGDDKDNKDFSAGMAGILANSKIAEFKISETFQYKDADGKIQTGYTGSGCWTSVCSNGGITLRPSENASGNGNWQIFVNPNAGEVATTKTAGLYWLTGGKGSLVSTNDSVDAHEFGHVWETWQGTRMYGTGRGQQRPLPDSIVFENSVHARYNRLRRVKH